MFKYILLTCAAISFTSVPSHEPEDIDFSRVKGKKVVKLLHGYDLESAADIAALAPSCYEDNDSLSYQSHTKVMEVDAEIDEVWSTYKSISPTEDNQNKVRFGLLFSPDPNTLSYSADSYDGIKEGQIVFWNLKFVMGLVKVPVGQKIMEVNNEDKFIKICYLAQGKSHGTQYIQLYPLEDGKTKIVHYTRYKSASKFRDKRLYPMFHNKAITEFHEDVINKVMEKKESEEEDNKTFSSK